MAAHPLKDGVVLKIRFLSRKEEHLDASENQKSAENIKDPIELLNENRPQVDEDRPHHDSADDTVEQNPLLKLQGNREVTENGDPNKHVLYGEAFLDEVPRDEFNRLLVRYSASMGTAEMPPEPPRERHGSDKPHHGPKGRFLHRHAMAALRLKHKEIDRQHHDD